MVDHLPSASHYGEAVAMDIELAELLEADGDRRSTESGPPLMAVSENTPVVQLLTRVVSLQQAQLQQKATKRIHFPPLPTVRTARHVVRERKRHAHRERMTGLIERAKARWSAAVAAGDDPTGDTPTALAATEDR